MNYDEQITPTPTAAAICGRFEPTEEATRLLANGLAAPAFFGKLVEAKLYVDAAKFLAYWLPPREAVWWACECAWLNCRPKPAPEAEAALQAAVAWVLEPSEQHRQTARAAAKAAGAATPAGAVAFAVAWSGGSMTEAELPAVPPPPFLYAKGVASAVLLAVAEGDAGKRDWRYRQLLRIGAEVARGQNRWERSLATV